jgi:DNA-binding IclR family transcriptional regulator
LRGQLGTRVHKQLFELYAGERLITLTDQTPTTMEALAARVARATADGYLVSRGSVEAGGISLSAPVHDRSGALVAAIDISCPASAYDWPPPTAVEIRRGSVSRILFYAPVSAG